MRIAFLASNRGSGMRVIHEAITAGSLKAETVLVVSNKATAGALTFARERSIRWELIPTLPDPDSADRQLCAALLDAHAELIILSGYLRKLGPLTLGQFAGRIMNTHPALLPKYGGEGMYGRRVHQAVLEAGERVTGATIHLVDGMYDHGPIVAQRTITIPDAATVEMVEKLVEAAEQALLVETLLNMSQHISGA